MKSLIQAVTLAALIAAPIASFAQSDQPVTRAEVKAQLQQLERAGYNPATAEDSTYPADIQAAEARVSTQNAMAQGNTSGYGTQPAGTTQTGGQHPMVTNPADQ
ncbi:DUF4148 domain-containing protein [Paraburkholderia antibiotica]|uniref:DUF4148 domain-containing protein n=1 Tax=Paraburkholderia antibiotica TaxID=2728839 RepID=A0A7X9ZXB7_9BURK|nr:DUF4148 domain-containing protein [Paraburkholderia antibiotica]NML31641.1 DUF4148 domain-containing protein [Paraburkholderia antibiotica]